jgi:hypothetical protein
MSLQDEMYKQMLRQKQLEEYNRQKKQQRSNYINSAKNFYDNIQNGGSKLSGWGKNLSQSQNPKLANLGTKMQTIGDKIQGFRQPGMPSLIGGGGVSTGAGGSAVANGISSVAPSATSTLGSGAGATTGLGSSLAGTSTGSSALGSSLLGATGGSSAGMGAAGATSAIGGSTAAATGAGAAGAGAGAAGAGAAGGAAMGAAGGAAMAVPVAGWVVAAALAAKAIKDKFDEAHKKVNAKAMQADSNAMQESSQANAEGIAQDQNAFQNAAMESAQQMTQPSTYDAMETQLPIGQDYAVNPETYSYPEEQEIGMPTGGAAPANNNFIQNLFDKYNGKQKLSIEPLREPIMRENVEPLREPIMRENIKPLREPIMRENIKPLREPIMRENIKPLREPYKGNMTGGAASILEDTTYPEEQEIGQPTGGAAPATTPQSTGQSIIDKLRNGLGDFRTGFDDNAQHGFMQGDLANKFAGTQTQQQPATPSPYELLANDMTAANFSPEQIKAAKQGLNGGNADIAALVDKYSINKPTTDEEIALAQAGNLNPQDATGSAAPLQGNVTKKSIMNRIGEAFGTGRRLLANPWVQAGIAGAITKATGGTTGDALTNAFNYGKEKQMADYYYKQMNPGATVTPILNNFGATDYKNQADIENANAKLQEQMYNNAFTRQLNQEKFDFDKDYKNRKYDLDERKFKDQAAYRRGQLGLQQQRLQIALANAGNKKERDRLLNDYKKQIQSDVADYITVPKKDKAGYKKYIVDKYGVDVLKYLNQADAKSGNSKSSNYSTQEDYVDNEESLYSNLPDWFYKDYEEED